MDHWLFALEELLVGECQSESYARPVSVVRSQLFLLDLIEEESNDRMQ
jgi:hypothetical protein